MKERTYFMTDQRRRPVKGVEPYHRAVMRRDVALVHGPVVAFRRPKGRRYGWYLAIVLVLVLLTEQAWGHDVCQALDVNGDGTVDYADGAVIAQSLGTHCRDCPADVNGDGVVGKRDVLLFINSLQYCDGPDVPRGTTEDTARRLTGVTLRNSFVRALCPDAPDWTVAVGPHGNGGKYWKRHATSGRVAFFMGPPA